MRALTLMLAVCSGGPVTSFFSHFFVSESWKEENFWKTTGKPARLAAAYLFEVSSVKPHVAIKGRDVLELSVAEIAFHRFRFRFRRDRGLTVLSRSQAGFHATDGRTLQREFIKFVSDVDVRKEARAVGASDRDRERRPATDPFDPERDVPGVSGLEKQLGLRVSRTVRIPADTGSAVFVTVSPVLAIDVFVFGDGRRRRLIVLRLGRSRDRGIDLTFLVRIERYPRVHHGMSRAREPMRESEAAEVTARPADSCE